MDKSSSTPRPVEVGGTDGDDLHKVNPLLFLIKLGTLAIWLTVAGSGVLLNDGPVMLGFQVLLAIGLAHATELVHQCLHRTATGIIAWDRAFGLALGLPTLVAYWSYLYCHFQHHRFNGTTRDGESFGYPLKLIESNRRRDRLLGILLQLSMTPHFAAALRRMSLAVSGRLASQLRAESPTMSRGIAARIEANYRLMAVVLTFGLATAAATGTLTVVVDLWIVPLALWAPIHALIELPEHILCDHPEGDTRRNTRSIGAGPVVSWITNFNHCHVGHHADFRIPPEKLVAFEADLRQSGCFEHAELSYWTFYRKFARYLIDGKPF